jgi:CDP-diacylglycerol--glycerol-3-phosphate 3-phosphatidyltransferase
MQFNLPTWLTLLRIILIPVMVALFYLPWHLAHVACGVVFAIAGFTDWLDGYLARKMSQTTLFGAFLDPVADKLMVSVALVLIVQGDPNPWIAIAAAVIIGREITIASLREWMAEIGQRNKVEVSWIGKWKTTAQMVAIVILLLSMDIWKDTLRDIGQVLLLISAVLTLWSMFNYMKAALPVLTQHDGKG